MKQGYTKLIPHLAVLAIFWLITVVYFKPLVFDDYTLPQHDIKQWKGGAKELIYDKYMSKGNCELLDFIYTIAPCILYLITLVF